MKFKGIIKHILPPAQGMTKNGEPWKSQEIVVEEEGVRYPSVLVFRLFNKPLEVSEGALVEVEFDGRASEYNGKWYNRLDVFRITNLST